MKDLRMFTVFVAVDDVDGENSFFVFEHEKVAEWERYYSYVVLPVSVFEGQYIIDKIGKLKEYIMKEKKCEWPEINKRKRMNDMVNPIMVCSFAIDESKSDDGVKR
ncbi:hypothetical protein [Escherichia phage ZL19]|uniref:Uncharacterized protein n=1 Tax=Escherichia phage ZL19 TaxID=2914037 RepID=A0A9E6YYI7_9CAUD|nr:hypothetical protein [Escherichia phage ZL19]